MTTEPHIEPVEWNAIKVASISDPATRISAVLLIVQKQQDRIKDLERMLQESIEDGATSQ